MNRPGARLARALALTSALAAIACQPRQSIPADESFRGKTIRLVVGFAAGGGYDVQARLLADHIGRYLPGAPAVVVENMPGAGGLIAAAHVDRQPPDGLTLGMLGAAPILAQAIDQAPVAFDVRAWTIIGSSTAEDDDVCVARKEAALTIERWRTQAVPVRAGGSGHGSTSHFRTALLASALYLPVRFVTGYRGTADMRLALEGGEIDVLCVGLNSYRSTMEPLGHFAPILQSGADPRITEQHVPSADTLVSDAHGRAMLDLLATLHTIDRYVVAPPGMAPAAAAVLRGALAGALQDRDYLAAAQAARIESHYVAATEVATRLSALFAMNADTRQAAKALLSADEVHARPPDVAR